jgi:hypothetical protein
MFSLFDLNTSSVFFLDLNELPSLRNFKKLTMCTEINIKTIEVNYNKTKILLSIIGIYILVRGNCLWFSFIFYYRLTLTLFKQTISRAKFTMLQLYILECYVHIIPDHIKGSVSEDFLEAENIAAVHSQFLANV